MDFGNLETFLVNRQKELKLTNEALETVQVAKGLKNFENEVSNRVEILKAEEQALVKKIDELGDRVKEAAAKAKGNLEDAEKLVASKIADAENSVARLLDEGKVKAEEIEEAIFGRKAELEKITSKITAAQADHDVITSALAKSKETLSRFVDGSISSS